VIRVAALAVGRGSGGATPRRLVARANLAIRCNQAARDPHQVRMRSLAVRVRAAHHTDVGMVRERNEDAVYVDPRGQFFIVADGMGGHAAGDVASGMAIDIVREKLEAARTRFDAFIASRGEDGKFGLKALLGSVVRSAHEQIRDRAACEADKYGMGTTIEVVLVLGGHALIAHVGDSRTYLVRGGRAVQLTRDHTMAQVAVIAGTLSAEDAPASPLSAMLTNALGCSPHVTIDIIHRTLRPGDRLLLCTDGLYDELAGEELESRVAACPPDRAIAELVGLARHRGGHDNITGVIIEAMRAAPAAWDDEPTTPRSMPRLRTPPRGTPAPEVVPANPLAFATEETLSGAIDRGLHEETGPVVVTAQ